MSEKYRCTLFQPYFRVLYRPPTFLGTPFVGFAALGQRFPDVFPQSVYVEIPRYWRLVRWIADEREWEHFQF